MGTFFRGGWFGALALAGAGAVQAADPLDNLPFAILGGAPSVDLRLRWERADNELPANPEDSQALTLRSRLSYTTGRWNGLDAMMEYEGINADDKTSYNSTVNGVANRPPIVDPTDSELNQAWLRYTGIPWTTLKAGRSRYVLDNHRFIGNVGWRQNEATFDGYSIAIAPAPVKGLEINLAHFDNLDSISFVNVPGDYEIANVGYAPGEWLKATVYGYFLDFSAIAPAANAQRQDSQTFGLRAAGKLALAGSFKLGYAAEFAQQSDYADAPAAVDADYLLIELAPSWGPLELKAGYEELGSHDGLYGLQTPLATLHAFQGWADVFLTTPPTGLRDTSASAQYTAWKTTLFVRAHRFEADFGGADYGDEIDASITRPLTKQLTLMAKYAGYDASAFATDTEKYWLQAEFKF